MSLSSAQRREYRAIAHHLKPVVTLGDKGLSEGVRDEIERALNDHELIKVKVAGGEKEARTEQADALCQATGAELVQLIGRVAVLLRRSRKPNPKLSNLSRAAGQA
ncbi:ribosome assembly RNA-binding protein YhbY [Hydrocarboniclastica marina]|uniref:Ribosome assembly RNA-binding protein YhbY n=1 Tax=Hydrocarboniclastica marina TaxID=2259620 RepID=A0A4P7XJQ1_9ALTE|nr:ribosome assembly RNA-binding protein YhbY [Alteromonadaceae bacterium]QCF27389.1 ribosome assembly RNA-binding protein YhbY [Hydrocarboniclastica marina]|tara:strand:+ start:1789 stop:2106 length:318 start_codon:yes stop_codon:yes gene_type:complete